LLPGPAFRPNSNNAAFDTAEEPNPAEGVVDSAPPSILVGSKKRSYPWPEYFSDVVHPFKPSLPPKVQIVVFLRLILTLFIEYLGEQLKSF